MSGQTMEEAVERFNAALDALQQALERRKANEDQLAEYEEDLHLMALDRAQLARRLDEALADARDNGVAHEELSKRIDNALSSINELIASAEAQ